MNDKKRNGKFYTPDPATQLLCSWAIRSPHDSVLEPSFGGCGFLVAARDRLARLGADSSQRNLFGCDVDPDAFSILERALGGDYDRRNFLLGDFLAVGNNGFHQKKFTAVIGNPPYVSLHNMMAEQRERARSVLSENADLSGKASLWAYFVLHSNGFIEEGGRAAWLLPGSFLYSEYAYEVRSALEKNFERTLAIELKQRLFLTEGTEETTVIVLCDVRQSSPANRQMQYAFCDDLAAASRLIHDWEVGTEQLSRLGEKTRFLALSPEQQSAYRSIAARDDTGLLGEFVNCRIGVVTGNNRFFVIGPSDAKKAGLSPKDYSPVVAKFRACSGISFTHQDVQKEVDEDRRCLLVSSYPDRKPSKALLRYLDTLPQPRVAQNKTFAKRTPWHSADDRRASDGFFPIMQTDGPRIVVNEAGINATNSVYRLYRLGMNDLRRLALGVLSTFSQLAAEIHGRSYGSGGLKLEPSDVVRIPIVLPNDLREHDLDREFRRVHSLLIAGNPLQARREVDEILFSESNSEELCLLRAALSETRRRRQRDSNRGD